MSIVGGFFNAKNVNGIYDRVYNAEDFAAYFANFISSGVFASPADQMKVVPGGGLSVDVSVGKGYIKGYWVNVTQTEHIVINPNMMGHEEQIKVVCKIDFDTRLPVLEVRENVDNLLPESEYELVLATFNLQVGESEITTAMIADRRPDKEYCGFVTGLVEQVDFKTLMEQEKAQFQEWFEDMKGQLSEDAAGKLQQQVDLLNQKVVINTTNTDGLVKQALAPNGSMQQGFSLERLFVWGQNPRQNAEPGWISDWRYYKDRIDFGGIRNVGEILRREDKTDPMLFFLEFKWINGNVAVAPVIKYLMAEKVYKEVQYYGKYGDDLGWNASSNDRDGSGIIYSFDMFIEETAVKALTCIVKLTPVMDSGKFGLRLDKLSVTKQSGITRGYMTIDLGGIGTCSFN